MGCPFSACRPTKIYDVFLSFRGEDTRDSFTSHLHEALKRQNIECCSEDTLESGQEIYPAIRKAIKKSKVSVVIFSNNYASSSLCLKELVQIMKCRKKMGQIVIPVFYGVDPSDVRKQEGTYELEYELESEREVKAWRKALNDASNIAGWDSRLTRPESKLVEAIVEDVMKKLNPPLSGLD